jgi:ABC-type transport system involved in multi-copper enzyme maturation permease subunit
MVDWIRGNLACYFGNATATRDYRVQLRGVRSILLWSFYLAILIGFAMLTYSNSASGYSTSIVDAQSRLRTFYQSIMILLGVMVVGIAPALTAGAIVMERQRRSLDLVFSAPVSPKYYLVGKMISSYRYIWMLLILSVPVTSACVVLGGATWSDVIAAYVILSLNALVYTAIALLISTLSKQPVAAIVWSYAAAIFYTIGTGVVSAASAVGMMSGLRGGLEAPYTITMNPFAVVQAAPTYSTIWGYQVPNWVLGAITAVLISKLLLLGAASTMVGYDAKETKSLRIQGWIYSFLFAALYAYATAPALTMVRGAMRASSSMGSGIATPTTWNSTMDLAFGWLLAPLVILIPFLSCYGLDAERRAWPDGTFSLQRVFKGTPSGGLPYIWGLILAAYLGFYFVHSQILMDPPSPAILLWSLAFWTFCWSLGRLGSGFKLGLRAARTFQFTIIIALVALPVPFMTAIHVFSSTDAGIWDLYILRPLVGNEDNRSIALFYSVLLAGASLVITFVAETTAARKGLKSQVQT